MWRKSALGCAFFGLKGGLLSFGLAILLVILAIGEIRAAGEDDYLEARKLEMGAVDKPKRLREAFGLYEKAASLGHPGARYQMAKYFYHAHYAKSVGVARDPNRTRSDVAVLAKEGYPPAIWSESVFAKDVETWMRMNERAAQGGLARAAKDLARFHQAVPVESLLRGSAIHGDLKRYDLEVKMHRSREKGLFWGTFFRRVGPDWDLWWIESFKPLLKDVPVSRQKEIEGTVDLYLKQLKLDRGKVDDWNRRYILLEFDPRDFEEA